MPDASKPRRILRDCSRAGHRIVTLVSAMIVERDGQKLLRESGVCRTCAAAVQRHTAIANQGEWTVHTEPLPHDGIIYACVPLREKVS